MTPNQLKAFRHPLIGRDGDVPQFWMDPPWSFGLSFGGPRLNGQPVWLASIGRVRSNGRTLYVPEWSPTQLRAAERLLLLVLDGVGNVKRERLFRMNITLCLHRAATDVEVQAQPEWFCTAPGGLAGGPVEVLRETEPGSASTRPCASPIRRRLASSGTHAWIPVDCGRCDSCRARAAIQ